MFYYIITTTCSSSVLNPHLNHIGELWKNCLAIHIWVFHFQINTTNSHVQVRLPGRWLYLHSLSIKGAFKGLEVYGLQLLPMGLWLKASMSWRAYAWVQFMQDSTCMLMVCHWPIQSSLLLTDWYRVIFDGLVLGFYAIDSALSYSLAMYYVNYPLPLHSV